MEWLPLTVGAVLGGVVGYGFRVAEAVRGDRVSSYLNYLRVINSFSMSVLATAEHEDSAEAERQFRSFQADAQRVSTELALVGSSRVVRAASKMNRALSSRELWAAIEELGRSPQNADVRSKFLRTYWVIVGEPRRAMLDAMRRDLRFFRLRGVTIDEVEGVRADGASPVDLGR